MSGQPDTTSEDLAPAYGAAVQGAGDDQVSKQMFDALDEADAPPAGQQEAKLTPRPPVEGATRTLRDLVTEKPRAPWPVLTGNPVTDATTVGADVVTGIAESPKAALGGVRNAAQELLDSIDGAGAWVAVNAARATGDEGKAKAIEDRMASGEGVLANALPEVGAPRSVTGGLIEGITQFATGFAAGGKALKTAGLIGEGASTAGVFLKSAFADAFAFDPAQQRLSNLIESNPALKNPVTEFLASKPGDSEAMGRMKNALEGLGVGAALQGVFTTALSGMRAVQALKPAVPTAEQIATHVREGLAPLGKADGPAFSVRKAGGDAVSATGAGDVLADASGSPLTVFHGTYGAFDEFKVAPGELGIHFGTSEQAGKRLEGLATSAKMEMAGQGKDVRNFALEGGNIRPAQLRMKNPLRLNDQLDWDFATVKRQLESKRALGGGKVFDVANAKSMGDLRDAIKGRGYDGIVYKNQYEGKSGADSYIAFSPDQVVKPSAKGASQAAAEGLVSVGQNPAGNEVFINFARIEAPDDIKGLLAKTANTFSDDVKAAQRGVQSVEATKALADDMGMGVGDLLARRRGPNGARAPFTAEEALAARRVYTASGSKLYELAEKAAGPNAGEIDAFNLRKMMSTHLAIQNEVLGARTETARALASWKIPAGAGEMQLRAIKQAMETAGPDTARMAKELVALKQTGATAGALAQYVRKSAVGTFAQGVREVYVNGLLSGPLTHIVNATGNLATLGLSAIERAVAAGISGVTGSGGVVSGEARSMLYGMIEGQRDALRLAWKATGDVPVDFMGKTDTPRAAAIASTRTDAFGTAVNVVGATTRAPSLLMSSADQYFKAVNYRAELHSLALRQATGEGLTGKAYNARVAELVANPPEHVQLQASDHAFYNTFNNSLGEWGQTLMKLRESGGALNPMWVIVPFIRTPANIARYAFERTPLAPLVGQWREMIKAGGRDRDIALARMATGTMIMGLAQAGAEYGQVTGARPDDANEAALWDREGKQAYSAKVGSNWYSFNRADPFGMIMGFAADMQTTLQKGDVAPKDVDSWQEIMGGGIAAISKTAMDKTFLRGVSQFNDMLADPTRYGPKEINSVITGFLPFGALSGAVAKLGDPSVKDVKTPIDSILSRIPGLAARIIPRRDLWGQTLTDPNAAQNAVNPLRMTQEIAAPIDAELDRLHVYPAAIGWKTGVNGVQVDFSDYPKALDEYRRLAGNDFKHPAWNMGLKDFLDQTVSGKGAMSQVYAMYSDGEQGGKQAFIKDWINKYRDMAARKLLDDPKFADFKAYWEDTKAAQRGARQRVTLQ